MDSGAPQIKQDQKLASILSSDAKKLLWVVAVFNWVSLLVFSRTALLDYLAFYTAGRLVASGQGHQLFNYAAQSAFQTGALRSPATLPYYHLAFESLLFVPFTAVSFRASLWLFRAALLLLLGVTARLARHTFGFSYSDFFALSFGFLSTASAVAQGQDSTVLLLLTLASFYSLMKARPAVAGVLLCLATFKPQFVFPLAVLVSWKEGRRFALPFAGGTLCLLTISTWITGLSGWVDWLELVHKAALASGKEIGASASYMPNLRGMLQTTIPNAQVAFWMTLAASSVLFVVTAWKLKEIKSPLEYFPPVVAMALLVSYHSNIHDQVLLLLTVFGLLSMQPQSKIQNIAAGLCFGFPIFLILDLTWAFAFIVLLAWWVSFVETGPKSATKTVFNGI